MNNKINSLFVGINDICVFTGATELSDWYDNKVITKSMILVVQKEGRTAKAEFVSSHNQRISIYLLTGTQFLKGMENKESITVNY